MRRKKNKKQEDCVVPIYQMRRINVKNHKMQFYFGLKNEPLIRECTTATVMGLCPI